MLLYEQVVRSFVRLVGDLPLKKYSVQDVEGFKARRLKEVSPVKVNIDFRMLKAFFETAVRWKMLRGSSSKLMDSVRKTKRECQVIDLISIGMTNKEIAQKLILSTYTVKSHVHNILEKLTLHTRVQIASYAHTSESFQEITNSVSLINE